MGVLKVSINFEHTSPIGQGLYLDNACNYVIVLVYTIFVLWLDSVKLSKQSQRKHFLNH